MHVPIGKKLPDDRAASLLGDPPPLRDLGLLGAAAARPATTAFSQDAYPDLWTKAAALLHGIVRNHALADGNKRLGLLATAVFLEVNGVEATKAAFYELVMEVASKDPTVDEIAAELQRICR